MRDWINPGKADGDRRYKLAYLQLHTLLACLAETSRMPNDTIVRCSLDVPEGTVVVERFYDHLRMSEVVVLYNPAWPTVALGESIPEIHCERTFVTVKFSEPAIRLDANLEAQQRYLTLVHNRMRAEIIKSIEDKTNRVVHTVRYDQEKQATRFLGENGELLDIIEDSDERLNTVSIMKCKLRFLEWTR